MSNVSDLEVLHHESLLRLTKEYVDENGLSPLGNPISIPLDRLSNGHPGYVIIREEIIPQRTVGYLIHSRDQSEVRIQFYE